MNRGTNNASIQVAQFRFNGALVEEWHLTPLLAPNGKLLRVFAELFPSNESGYYEVRSTEPCSILSLRGSLSLEYLWENLAIPIP